MIYNYAVSYFINLCVIFNMPIPSYYINLDRSPERNTNISESLKNLNTTYYRVSGIDMDNITRNDFNGGIIQNMQYAIKKNKVYNPKGKEIAIILSHFKALQEIIKNDNDIAIILEDDMSFQYVTDWNKQIDEIILKAPSNWNIIKLHSSLVQRIEKNILLCKDNIFYDKLNNTQLQSAGCYIIKKSAAKLLVSRYYIDNIYNFPYENEYCVCECIIFSIPDVYMYTLPLLCSVNNNVTCAGNYNLADIQSNKLIHSYWNNANNIVTTNNNNNKKTIKVMSIKNMKNMR